MDTQHTTDASVFNRYWLRNANYCTIEIPASATAFAR